MPLIVDPALQARVVRQFNLRGELAPFNLTENVIPTIDIGRLVGADPTVVTTLAGSQGVRVGTTVGEHVRTQVPAIEDGNVVDGGFSVNPGAAALLVDGGPVSSSRNRTIDIYLNGNAIYDLIVEWRNAANAANLATWSLLVGGVGVSAPVHWGPHNLNMLLNERVRVVTGGAVVGTVSSAIHVASAQSSSAS